MVAKRTYIFNILYYDFKIKTNLNKNLSMSVERWNNFKFKNILEDNLLEKLCTTLIQMLSSMLLTKC